MASIPVLSDTASPCKFTGVELTPGATKVPVLSSDKIGRPFKYGTRGGNPVTPEKGERKQQEGGLPFPVPGVHCGSHADLLTVGFPAVPGPSKVFH